MSTFTDTSEKNLENIIESWLVNHNGYEKGVNADYNKDFAVEAYSPPTRSVDNF